MDWIAISVTIAGDPAVHRMAAALRVRVAEVVGLLGLTFAGMAQHAPDGQLADVPDTLLEQWSTWHGKRGAFAAQFRTELCDEAGVVRAWDRYNGRNIRRAKAAAERTRAWREQPRESVPSANGNGHRTHTRTHTVRRTEQDRTGQDLRARSTARAGRSAPAAPPPDAPPAPAWVATVADRWRDRVGRITPAVVRRELAALIGLHGEAALLRAIDAYVEHRITTGKPPKLAWFAEEASAWVERAKPIVDPDTGLLTLSGMAVVEAMR